MEMEEGIIGKKGLENGRRKVEVKRRTWNEE